MKVLVVGAGVFGATCARQLHEAGYDVQVVERAAHVGGHCYSHYVEEAGCHQHVFGPHIFHTDDERVWAYVNRFAQFNHFVNRPKVCYEDTLYSFPINLMTMQQVFGVHTPEEAETVLNGQREPIDDPANMEEWCLANIGRTLYAMFIEGYTSKQWGKHPRELPPSIIKRVPIRMTFDDNYFTHPHQGIPKDGYTALFEAMLDGIPVELETDFLGDRDAYIKAYDRVIYSGAIDEFFGYQDGVLAYRSLRFEHELVDKRDFQGNAVINYTEQSVPFTRVIEHKHFDLNLDSPKTLVTREDPAEWALGDTPYYPVGTDENRQIYERLADRAAREFPSVVFGGRLGRYRYLNMDQVVAMALELCDGFETASG